MSGPPKPDPEKHCETCGALMTRKRYGRRLEDRNVFLRRRHCSLRCANTRREVVKDTHHWRARKFRQAACEECATTVDLHVHHNDRDHTNNDPSNLRTLCSSCHLKLHWREDREKRLRSLRAAVAAAVQSGANLRPRSTDGRWRSVDPRPRQPN